MVPLWRGLAEPQPGLPALSLGSVVASGSEVLSLLSEPGTVPPLLGSSAPVLVPTGPVVVVEGAVVGVDVSVPVVPVGPDPPVDPVGPLDPVAPVIPVAPVAPVVEGEEVGAGVVVPGVTEGVPVTLGTTG